MVEWSEKKDILCVNLPHRKWKEEKNISEDDAHISQEEKKKTHPKPSD
jgi:hypothetical protein